MYFSTISLSCVVSLASAATKPNVVMLLTDDQDYVLGSMDPEGPLQKTRKLIVEQGAWFNNGFATTPICCPSRAEITTGRYMHNTKVYGNDCGGMDFINGPEKLNVAHYAKSLGYTTFYAGKYLNNYGNQNVGGLGRWPTGWDQWYGLQGNSKYYSYTVSNNGVGEAHGMDYAKDYFTDRLANRSLEFLANVTQPGQPPFFMMIGTPACHGPNDPAPQYSETYAGRKSPRVPSWNLAPQPNKHWLLRQIVPMDAVRINVSDIFYQRRWSVLRSVDDMVERLVDFMTKAKVWDNTYFIYTSDHGYHLGEFGMLYDKRMLYETDIRVPLFVKGPGIAAGTTFNQPAIHIDLAPTMLNMMGLAETPSQMDGESWLPLVAPSSESVGGRDAAAKVAAEWRQTFMVEYSGGGNPVHSYSTAAMLAEIEGKRLNLTEFELTANANANVGNATCVANADDELSLNCKCSCTVGAVTGKVQDQSPCDGANNTYACYRTIGTGIATNTIYCEFVDDESFVEYYDLSVDPWNLDNLVSSTPKEQLQAMSAELAKLKACTGVNCRNTQKSSSSDLVEKLQQSD